MNPARLIVITGPTASGKSELAILVALALDADILSADSMQVYRGMDIGTAKPTKEDCVRVRHYGIDVESPYDPYTVSDYCDFAKPIIEKAIQGRQSLVICGGTGLYLKALLEGLADAPPPDYEFRRKLEAEVEEQGTAFLHSRLTHIDPESAERIHSNDQKRIIRALEIYEGTGITKSQFEEMQEAPPWNEKIAWFGIEWPWEDLFKRIDHRVDRMIEAGLVEEVVALQKDGQVLSHTASQALGYKEILDHLSGEGNLEDTIALIKQHIRRFARRQMSWFRPNKKIHWLQANAAIPNSGRATQFRDEVLENLVSASKT